MRPIAELKNDEAHALIDLACTSAYIDYRSLRFLYYLILKLQPKVVVETGTFHGASAAHMAKALPDDGYIVTIDDQSTGISSSMVKANMAALDIDLSVHIVRADSRHASDALREIIGDDLIDLVFFDADHSYEAVSDEYESLLPLLSDDAVLIFDDMDLPAPDGVQKFVDKIRPEYTIDIYVPFHKGVTILTNDRSKEQLIEDAAVKAYGR